MLDEAFLLCASSFDSALGDAAANLERIAEEAARAAEAGARLLATPENSVCGHVYGPALKLAVEPLRGKSVEVLTALARKHNLLISAGIGEESPSPDGWPYNTQVLVGPEGLLGKQRKVHLSNNENCYIHPGDQLEWVDAGPWRIGTVICYDNLFPELHRILALRGCELILCPHAARIGDPTGKDLAALKAEGLLASRLHHQGLAYSNATYNVYVNQVGISGRCQSKRHGGWVAHAGGVFIADPHGHVVAEGGEREAKPERVLVRVDRAVAASRRSTVGFSLSFRRPELFAALSDPAVEAAYRARYGVPDVGSWWAEEGMAPARRP